MWLETKVVPDHKQYTFILQLLSKEGPWSLESFLLAAPKNNDKEQPDQIWEAFEGFFRQTTNFRCYREQILNNFYQQDNESIWIGY